MLADGGAKGVNVEEEEWQRVRKELKMKMKMRMMEQRHLGAIQAFNRKTAQLQNADSLATHKSFIFSTFKPGRPAGKVDKSAQAIASGIF